MLSSLLDALVDEYNAERQNVPYIEILTSGVFDRKAVT
jgi:hypothetical protein